MSENIIKSHQLLKSMPKILHNGLVQSHMGAVQSWMHEIQSEVSRPHRCPFCDRPFRRLEHMRRHTRVHTREKPYVCQDPRCLKKFSRSDDLIRHSRIHAYSQLRAMTRTDEVVPTSARKAMRQRESWSDPARRLPSLANVYLKSAPASVPGSPSSNHMYSTDAHPHFGINKFRLFESSKNMKDAVDTKIHARAVCRSESFKQEYSYSSPPHSPSGQLQHVLCSNSSSLYTVQRPHYVIEHQGCLCVLAQHSWPGSPKSLDLLPAIAPRIPSPQTSDHGLSFETDDSAVLPSIGDLPIENSYGNVAPKSKLDGRDRYDGGVGTQMKALRISELLS